MQKKYRNQTSEQLCNFVLKIMIFKNLIPSIWTKPPRRLELINCGSKDRNFNY